MEAEVCAVLDADLAHAHFGNQGSQVYYFRGVVGQLHYLHDLSRLKAHVIQEFLNVTAFEDDQSV